MKGSGQFHALATLPQQKESTVPSEWPRAGLDTVDPKLIKHHTI
jgi:hypothetical protein